jgi:hypothetical protein
MVDDALFSRLRFTVFALWGVQKFNQDSAPKLNTLDIEDQGNAGVIDDQNVYGSF